MLLAMSTALLLDYVTNVQQFSPKFPNQDHDMKSIYLCILGPHFTYTQ